MSFSNVGTFDRIIRFLAGIALVAFGMLANLGDAGIYAAIAVGAGVVFALTGIVSFCPIYRLMGWHTTSED
jgi:Inner membrane protein YgaP-like, transmembrane domain